MNAYVNLSDGELLSLIAGGNARAFAEVYNRYWSVLYLYAKKFAGRNDQVEDILQDVFISLWNRADELELQTTLTAYLYTSVRYKIFDLLDHEKVRAKHQSSFKHFLEQSGAIADDLVIEKELAFEIESAIRSLPTKMREVFELSRKQGLSQKEIAFQLNISDKTVKKQVSNALKILRLKLDRLMSILMCF